MKIIADENMPLVREMFAGYGDVVTLPGRTIQPSDVADADVLLVRSVTRVDEALLKNSPVKFVGTATIGVDHVDQGYLQSREIAFANAPGCNANAVVDYVFAALSELNVTWQGKEVGIIGCGNVGGRLHRRFKALGVVCHCYDPFLTPEQNPDLCDLEAVLSSDIVSMHTPYTVDGPFPTRHMIRSEQLASLKSGAVLINAGRGPAIAGSDLLALLQNRDDLKVVLDVWEFEPEVDQVLLNLVSLGTPHIAGYSVQGKTNGTRMVRDAFLTWQGKPVVEEVDDKEKPVLQAAKLSEAVLAAYDIKADDHRMREALVQAGEGRAEAFDHLRKTYPHRNEYSRYRVQGPFSAEDSRQLQILGFEVVE